MAMLTFPPSCLRSVSPSAIFVKIMQISVYHLEDIFQIVILTHLAPHKLGLIFLEYVLTVCRISITESASASTQVRYGSSFEVKTSSVVTTYRS